MKETTRSYRQLFRRVGVGTDIGATVILQGFGALLAYLVNRTVARALGPDGWDSYSLCMHTYILIGTAVTDFGIVAVAMPRIAAARGEYSPAFKGALNLRLITFTIGLAVALTLVLLYGDTGLLIPVGIGFCAVLFSSKLTGLRQIPEMVWRLKGRTWIISTIAVIDAVILLAMLLLLDHSNALTVRTAMLALVLSNIPGFIVVTAPILASYSRAGYLKQRIPGRYYRSLVTGAAPIAVMAISSQLFARVEPLVINATIGRAYVGDYVAGILPLAGTLFFAVSVGVGLWPLITQIHRRLRNDITAGWVISVGARVLGGIAILVSMVCFLFSKEIMGIFDPDYVKYAYILRIYSITNGLEYLVVLFDQTLLAVDARKEMMIGTLLSLVLALGFQFGAISVWGIMGILVAKIGAILCKIAYQLYVLGPDIRSGALKAFLRLSGGAAVMALALIGTASLSIPIIPRAGITFLLVAASLFVFRIIDFKELKVLRKLQLG